MGLGGRGLGGGGFGAGGFRDGGRAGAALASLVLAAVASCGAEPGEGDALALLSVDPGPGAEALLLNDAIRLTFSAPVDPTTVTRDSVRLVDEATGVEARGDWEVDGRLVRFLPDGVRSRSLGDGGLAPGHRYRLVLTGFPFLGAVRSTAGASLDRSAELPFEVVSVEGAERGSSPVLRDASPGRAAPLRVAAGEPGSSETLPLPWDEALELRCDEPIDPRSLDPSDYEFRLAPDASPWSRQGGPSPAIQVARIEVVSNRSEESSGSGGEPGARLRVHPRTPFPVASGRGPAVFEFRRRGAGEGGLRDFSGTSVGWRQRSIRFFVARWDVRSPESANSYTFDFADDLDFVPVLDRFSDGTARWVGNGRLDVRLPAAVGDGRAGDVILEAAEGRADVAATRLTLPEGTRTELTGSGLVVLRSQGRVDLDGDLFRPAPAGEVPGMWDPSRLFLPGDESESLSAWLRRAREADHPWTVVIAGGDLVVRGTIDVGTPLLLVAGGRIRGAGRPRAAKGQLWLLGEGGGFELPHQRDPNASPNVVPPLSIDEPVHNPLVRPLTFVALSSPVPKGQRPRLWLEAEVLGHRGARGDYRVQFLRADVLQRGEQGLAEAARFDQPGLVVDPGGGAPVRMRVELIVHPRRGLWDPPYVDRVELAWSPER